MSDFDVDRNSPFYADPKSLFSMAKTYVLWDVEDCPIPPGLSASDVFINIETFLQKSGHYGSVSIMPCADLDHLKDDFVGIPVSVIASEGNREIRLKRFLLDLFILPIREYHQPLNLMLIVGDINSARKDLDFFEVFRLLKSRSSYKIILAQSPNPSEEKLSLTIDGLREGLSAGQDLLSNKL
ncbi:hypothetical protein V5N11_035264 [Cardamine amara subsp. amara]|uniref:NYN domain-containing protein n=1 Tax=Cardamine amara subsp. amara TaxID=228776 RepID=A0ABD0Z4I6_CARAN